MNIDLVDIDPFQLLIFIKQRIFFEIQIILQSISSGFAGKLYIIVLDDG